MNLSGPVLRSPAIRRAYVLSSFSVHPPLFLLVNESPLRPVPPSVVQRRHSASGAAPSPQTTPRPRLRVHSLRACAYPVSPSSTRSRSAIELRPVAITTVLSCLARPSLRPCARAAPCGPLNARRPGPRILSRTRPRQPVATACSTRGPSPQAPRHPRAVLPRGSTRRARRAPAPVPARGVGARRGRSAAVLIPPYAHARGTVRALEAPPAGH